MNCLNPGIHGTHFGLKSNLAASKCSLFIERDECIDVVKVSVGHITYKRERLA